MIAVPAVSIVLHVDIFETDDMVEMERRSVKVEEQHKINMGSVLAEPN